MCSEKADICALIGCIFSILFFCNASRIAETLKNHYVLGKTDQIERGIQLLNPNRLEC